jgi:hypothetical protein
MANEEHLAILRQGVDVWNKWRKKNPEIIPDLSEADLERMDLKEVDLERANLHSAKLNGANLRFAVLSYATLEKAEFFEATLFGTLLNEANLKRAILFSANLQSSILAGANLQRADLRGANLFGTFLSFADVTDMKIGFTSFSGIDLSEVENLAKVVYDNPCSIGIDTLLLSKGKIPIEFLEGCGVPKHVIENMQYLVDIPAIQYYSCFISYSTKDDDFAQQLNDRMKREGLRVWYAPEEMKAGQKIHEQLYEAIRYYEKLILVLSEASMNSNWVQSEIRRARKHEREDKRRKLFPISLVPFGEIQKWELFDADEGRDLGQEIREYYIPDFSQWKNYDKFNAEFEKLLKALKTEE